MRANREADEDNTSSEEGGEKGWLHKTYHEKHGEERVKTWQTIVWENREGTGNVKEDLQHHAQENASGNCEEEEDGIILSYRRNRKDDEEDCAYPIPWLEGEEGLKGTEKGGERTTHEEEKEAEKDLLKNVK